MGEWILLKNEAELEAMAKALRRRCRGHYYTNYFFINSTRNNDLRYTEMFYQSDGDNLYAIERKDNFYQLFYFVGDVDSVRLDLPPSVDQGVLTCEIFDEEGKDRQRCVLEKLYMEGFCVYKKYHFYERKRGEFRGIRSKSLNAGYQASEEELSIMYDIFDPYSDNLPLRKAFPEFLASMNIISFAVGGEYVGSYLYKKNNWGSNGYAFVRDKFLGLGSYVVSSGLATQLLEHPNWRGIIDDNNTKSIRLNEALGVKRTKQYEMVLIRGK